MNAVPTSPETEFRSVPTDQQSQLLTTQSVIYTRHTGTECFFRKWPNSTDEKPTGFVNDNEKLSV